MSFRRGMVWLAGLPDIGEKRVVIVSADFLNAPLASVVVARIGAVERERALPTFVKLHEDDVPDLPSPSFVICHDLFTLPKGVFKRALGIVPGARMLEIERALSAALDL